LSAESCRRDVNIERRPVHVGGDSQRRAALSESSGLPWSGDHWLTSQEPRGDTDGAAVCCRLPVVLSVPFERLDLSGQVFVLKAKKLEIPSSRGSRSGRCHLSEPLGLVQIIPGPRRILHARRTGLPVHRSHGPHIPDSFVHPALGRVLIKTAASASPRLSAKHPSAEAGASRGNGTD
jgi:hypothetical protein